MKTWLSAGLGAAWAIAGAGCQLIGGIGDIELQGDAGGPRDDAGRDAHAATDGHTSRDGGKTPQDAAHKDASVCPKGLSCAPCAHGTTSIRGKVLDPAGKNPVYGVTVYVPASPLPSLPRGVPVGASACSCRALFPKSAFASTVTGIDGSFTLAGVPAGHGVPLVLQLGKWRRSLSVDVAACTDNALSMGSLTLPGTITGGSKDDNMPDFAVSTGAADTLECLLVRAGISRSEYVAGSAMSGRVHMFSGGTAAAGGGAGIPEVVPFPGSPASHTDLWSTAAQMMPYDLILLSCEGGETYQANPAAMESYLNAGGRAVASHFHYSWFTGSTLNNPPYAAPADWNTNLATWIPDQQAMKTSGIVDTTLTSEAGAFQRGAAMATWLSDLGALGMAGAPSTELNVYEARFNATVGPANTASQAWITTDPSSAVPGAALAFAFDTPVTPPDGGATHCGRAVFSDLHADGDPNTGDDLNAAPPGSCRLVPLSPQEDALEFMLFDLLSCVAPNDVDPEATPGL